jgi:hypothetical protein
MDMDVNASTLMSRQAHDGGSALLHEPVDLTTGNAQLFGRLPRVAGARRDDLLNVP